MGIKLTVESFLKVVNQSGLIKWDALDQIIEDLKAAGVDMTTSAALASAFVERDLLTQWQANKLLQGKHKGFSLGKYRLLNLLGRGGMGSVYLAEHVLMRRRCAIKVLPAKQVKDSSHLARFHREAQAVASLDHPNIVRAYDVDREEVEPGTEVNFLVMEFVDGRSLQDLVVKEGPLDFVAAADFIRQAAAGLHHAHEAGLVHRDVKPANLLIDGNGVVKILDLGLAQFFNQSDENPLTLEYDEKVLGTVDFLAPEQAMDSHKVDVRADIYSLGCTAYYALTAQPPFPEGTLAQRVMAHQRKTPPPLENKRPDVPPALSRVVLWMLAKDPDQRPPDAQQVEHELTRWLAENADEQWKTRNAAAVAAEQSATNLQAQVSEADAAAKTTAGQNAPTVRESDQAATDSVADPGLSAFLSNLNADATNAPAIKTPAERKLTAEQHSATEGTDADGDGAAISRGIPADATPAATPPQTGTAPANVVEPDSPATSTPLPVAVPVAQADQLPVAAPVNPIPTATPHETGSSASPTPAIPVAPVATPVEPSPAPRTNDDSAIPEFQVDTPARRTASRKRSRRRKTRGTKKPSRNTTRGQVISQLFERLSGRQRIIAAGIVVLLLGLIGYGVMRFAGSDTEEPVAKNSSKKASKTQKQTGEADGSKAAEDVSVKPASHLEPGKQEIHVGAKGDFQTIAEAIDYVKANHDAYSTQAFSRHFHVQIKIDGGKTYKERIVVDNSSGFSFPKGLQLIVDGDQKAVLAPTGDGPVIQLKRLERAVIKGFEIQAGGAAVGIDLSDWLTETKLIQLEISGFKTTGIRGTGIAGTGNAELLLEDVTIHGESPNAVGIRLAEGGDELISRLNFNKVRCFGPMAAGMAIEANASHLRIHNMIFSGCVIGLHFAGKNQNWQDISVRNNSFHNLERGVVFNELPSNASRGLAFQLNVFTQVKGPELVIEKNYKEDDFNEMLMGEGMQAAIANNWSDRPAPDKPATGERERFIQPEARTTDLGFVSTDPKSGSFLKPTKGSPLARGLSPHAKYVGAIQP